jgi:imidazolonepropionase-like amidohydrolase
MTVLKGSIMLLIRGGSLIDGTGADPIPNAAILIDNDRITALGPQDSVAAPDGVDVVDLNGATILPGLIDVHDHLGMHSYGLVQNWGLAEPASTSALRTAAVLRETLATGYTTVRDAGGLDIGFKRAVEQGITPGPRLILTIGIISPTGGIADSVSPSGYPRTPPPPPTLPSGVGNGPDEVRAAVRRMIRAGADAIKCATTGGASSPLFHGPKDPAFTLLEMQALVDEAHTQGKLVLCHAIGGSGLRVAIEAGVDSIEHGGYLDEDPDLIPIMIANNTSYCPTLTVYEFHRTVSPPFMQERTRAMDGHQTESIRLALQAGVNITAGTDAGGHEHNINAREIDYLGQAGLSSMQAIQAATGWAARALALQNEIGTLEVGKIADLVAFDGDPLADLSLLHKTQPKLVVQSGERRIDRTGAGLPALTLIN